jgi:hypothetical protein
VFPKTACSARGSARALEFTEHLLSHELWRIAEKGKLAADERRSRPITKLISMCSISVYRRGFAAIYPSQLSRSLVVASGVGGRRFSTALGRESPARGFGGQLFVIFSFPGLWRGRARILWQRGRL